MFLFAGLTFGTVSCSDDNDPVVEQEEEKEEENKGERTYFNLVVSTDVEGSSGTTYTAAYEDLSDTGLNISFNGWGYEVPSVRTARVYADKTGEILYNLSYGGGTVSKYTASGGQTYAEVKTLDISLAMGTNNPRWTKVSEDYASIHHVVTEHQYADEAETEYTYTNTTGILTAIALGNFSVVTDYNEGGGASFDFPRSAEDIEENLHVWRIDAPAIHGGRAYYGLNKRSWDPETAANVSRTDYSASSLAVDFPSFANPKIITSTIAKGSTQGYRTPVAHADEKGDIYQITASDSHLLKISNDDYDNSYVFSLSDALGMEVGSNGWFYVGDGIGYVPFYDMDKGSGSAAAAWGVARVDLYNKTAVRMNLPEGLWLQQYQYSIVGNDGMFYMALAPLGGSGKIYILDPSSTSADAFTTGASIETIDSSSAYLGIF